MEGIYEWNKGIDEGAEKIDKATERAVVGLIGVAKNPVGALIEIGIQVSDGIDMLKADPLGTLRNVWTNLTKDPAETAANLGVNLTLFLAGGAITASKVPYSGVPIRSGRALGGSGVTLAEADAGLAARAAQRTFGGCFGAGTHLRTPQGSRSIESFIVGDEVLTRSELDPESPITIGHVKDVIRRHALIWRLKVNGRELLTTDEHPFWVRNRGWVAANQLIPGDVLRTLGGSCVVELSEDTGETADVYNLTIDPHHTYFASDSEWGFAVWAHNAINPCATVSGTAPKMFNGGTAQVNSTGVIGPKAPKPTPKFQTPTNPPALPPVAIPPGYRLFRGRPTQQYPNGYWKVEKWDGKGWQRVQPYNPKKTGIHPETHVEFPPGYNGPWDNECILHLPLKRYSDFEEMSSK